MIHELEVLHQQEELKVSPFFFSVYLIHLIRNLTSVAFEQKVTEPLICTNMIVEVVSQFHLITLFQR